MANAPSYQPFFTPDVNKQIMAAQQQQALAQALLQEGETPISTNNRMMGNIGYRISPLEGAAKLADILSGKQGLSQGNQDYANAFSPPPQAQQLADALQSPPNGQSASVPSVEGPQQLPPIDPAQQYRQDNNMQPPPIDAQRQAMGLPVGSAAMGTPPSVQPQTATQQPWSPYSAMGSGVMKGDPQSLIQYGTMLTTNPDTARAGAELIGQGMAGAKAYQTKVGENAAALAPPGTMPPGVPSPVNSSVLQPGASAPQAGGLPPPPPPPPATALPTGANVSPVAQAPNPASFPTTAAYQAAMKAFEANQSAQGSTEGDNAAENLQQYNSSRSQTQAVLDKINDMHQANKSSSFNGANTEEGGSPVTVYHRLMGDPTSQANTKLEQLKEQGLISQIGPQLAGTGSKGNKLLEGIIQGSDSFKLNVGKPAVATSIDGLGLNYIRNQVGQYDKAVASGGSPPPMSPVLMRTPKGVGYVNPRDVGDVINKGGTFDLSNNPLVVPPKASP